MKKLLLKIIVIIFWFNIYSQAQPIPDSALYLGQSPPGKTPKVFAQGLLAGPGHFAAERIAVSADRREIYYCEVNNYPITSSGIKFFKYSNNRWDGPFTLFGNFDSPSLCVNDSVLLFQNSQQVPWFSNKIDTGWSNPAPFNNRNMRLHYLQLTNSSKYFISANSQNSIGAMDWSTLTINGPDTTVRSLGLPLNSSGDDLDFFISKDESYIIISSTTKAGYGQGDLFVSYKKEDGKWTNPKNLGSTINTSGWEWGPYVTPDSLYMFFSRAPGTSDNRIYWVGLGNILDSLKHTNYEPYVKTIIPNQETTKGILYRYHIPDTTFTDDDGETLSYNTALSNGNQLPSWLNFNADTKTFSGIPDETGILNIKITAADNAQAKTSITFRLNVKELTVDYFGQTAPGDSAVIFSPGIISKQGRFEHAAVYSRDGKEFYFSETPGDWVFRNTYSRRYINNSWTDEQTSSFSASHKGGECTISSTNDSLIYTDGYDFWLTTRNDTDWTEPAKLPNEINSFDVQWHPSISANGNIYFSSKGNIYKSEKKDNVYSTPVSLPSPVNSNNWDADVVIAADESYIIFNSDRTGGFGNADLYISYYNNGTWTKPINLGSKINSDKMDDASSFSPDGKYFFFSRRTDQESDIFWVSTNFIDSLRQLLTGTANEKSLVPEEFYLGQNYPNPFNPSTNFEFRMVDYGLVVLKVFDVLGNEIKTLVNERKEPGNYTVNWNADKAASGVYFYTIHVVPQNSGKEIRAIKKMVLVK